MARYFRDDDLRWVPNYGVLGAIPERAMTPDWASDPQIRPPANPARPFGDPPKIRPRQKSPRLDLKDLQVPGVSNPANSPAQPAWPLFPGPGVPENGEPPYDPLLNAPTQPPHGGDLKDWLLALLEKNSRKPESNNSDAIPAENWARPLRDQAVITNARRGPRSAGSTRDEASELRMLSSSMLGVAPFDPRENIEQRQPEFRRSRGFVSNQRIDERTVPPPIFFPLFSFDD